jgi:DNA-binding CsgD family transcriptional regulator
MHADRISRLTESQRAYLRLVYEHQSSKQIAQRFDISAHTVDKRIKEAMRLLDVGSRVEAARIVVAAENIAGPPLGPQSPDLAIPRISANFSASDSRGDDKVAISSRVMVGEDQHSFRGPSRPAFPLPFPTGDRRENNLSVLQRLGWTVGLVIGLALATGILLSGLTALGTLFVALRH